MLRRLQVAAAAMKLPHNALEIQRHALPIRQATRNESTDVNFWQSFMDKQTMWGI